MSHSNQEIVYEGWLTKSPPTKRIWRAKWRRRWFALRQSGELPGQYFLDYYADRNCRKLKGRINLDLCDQVDAGLYMERGNSGVGSKLRGSVFSVRTQARTYHLEADCEADMEKWVDAICRVCGLRADDTDEKIGTFTSNLNTLSVSSATNNSDPYIRISECITGPRSQDCDRPRAFTFNAQGTPSVVTNQPEHNRVLANERMRNNDAPSDNTDDSNPSEDECSQSVVLQGPAVPPRPPKTFRLIKDGTHREHIYVGSDIVKYTTSRNTNSAQRAQYGWGGSGTEGDWSQHNNHYANTSTSPVHYQLEHPSNQYCNLLSMPPAVDRALKPRHASHSAGHIHSFFQNNQPMYSADYHWTPTSSNSRADFCTSVLVRRNTNHMGRSDTLQYLDLDLHTSTRPSTSKESARRNTGVSHVKSQSACDESESDYKTVDFLKTEALNMTRKDAEALRNNAMAL